MAVLIFTFAQHVNAAYLKNVPQTITQPDGTVIKCFATGDEFHNWLHDENNYTIIQGQDGVYYYAVKSGDQIVPSEYVVGKTFLKSTHLTPGVNLSPEQIMEKRRRKFEGFPGYQGISSSLKNSNDTLRLNNLVIYIRFSDENEFSTDTTIYSDLMNDKTPGANSMYNYYQEVSYGKAFFDSHLFPRPSTNITISYQDTKPRGYFRPYNATTNPDGYDPDVDSVRRNREFKLLERAVKWIEANETLPSVDFDFDNDLEMDVVSFIIKGESDGWNDLLWPHNWAIFDRTVTLNGLRVFNFNFFLEVSTRERGNGVLSHEMGHAIGFPDLYHYVSDGTPVGPWDIMASTVNPPQGIGAYLKHWNFRRPNTPNPWIDTIPEITEAGTYSLNALSSDTNNVYKIASPYSETEYFILEFRKKEPGKADNNLPASGLLVYRINEDAVTYRGGGNSQGPPDEIYVYRPNGTLSADGDINDAVFSRQAGRQAMDNTTNPSPFLSNGKPGGLYISNVGSSNGTSISFDVSFNPDALFADFLANNTRARVRDTIKFTDASAGSPPTLEWTFEGGIPATFTGVGPVDVIYPDTGTFDVTLRVTSSEGTSTEVKEDYITINEIPGTIPPQNTGYQGSGDDVILNWTAPSLVGAEAILQWDDNNNEGRAIGNGETAASFDALSYWTPSQIASFDGWNLTKIAFVPSSIGDNTSVKNYSLRVYNGTNAVNQVVDQSIPETSIQFGQWNEYSLDIPYTINASEGLYFGVNNNSGSAPQGFPIGVDEGPATTDHGDVILETGTLATLTGYGLDHNWNLAATVVNPSGTKATTFILKNQEAILKSIQGYNVYRNETRLNSTVLTTTTYTDADVPDGSYIYYVTTVFASGESTPSNKLEITVSNGTVGIDDLPVEEISIYPNPVQNTLSLALGELRNQEIIVKIFDQNGRTVYLESENSSDSKLDINVGQLKEGFYILNLIGEEVIYQAKFIISR